MAPFFILTETLQIEYDKASINTLKELDFWVLYNDWYIETDRAYRTLLARFENYMGSPSLKNNRKLKSTIKSFQKMGAGTEKTKRFHKETNKLPNE